MNKKTMRNFAYVVVVIQVLIIIFTLVRFQIQDMTLSKGEVYDFNENWTILWENDTRQEIDALPFAGKCKAEEMVVLENTIPEEYWGLTLSFLSADKVLKVYIDGEMIYEFGTTDERTFGHTPGSVINFIDIPSELEQGKIRIEMVSPYDDYAANISTMIIAKRDIAILHLIKNNILNILCGVIVLFAGTVLGILALMQKISKKSMEGMVYLGWFCMECCFYQIIETKTLSVFFGNQTFYSTMVFLILMRMPILLLLYYGENLPPECGKKISVLLYISFANNIVQILLQVLNIVDFMEMVSISHVIIFVTIVTMQKCYYDVYKKRKRRYGRNTSLYFSWD